MKVKIKRQDNETSAPYWQTFDYDLKGRETVMGILDNLNYRDDLFDEEGNPCRRIRFECSCMQKMCGACAMVINHTPALACQYFVEDKETDVLVLEPLSKFPVISDLRVDRSCITEHQKQAEIYLGEKAKSDQKEFINQYEAAKCLKCGLCLEVCPNYTGDGSFFGAVMANEAYLMHSSGERKKEIKNSYRQHFEKGCSKSLACQNICPMKIETLSSIGYMNRKK